MSIGVLARFHTQSEAKVAASVLQSAGFDPLLFDEYYGGVDWVAQSALGGYRLMLPVTELTEASSLLRDCAGQPPDVADATPNPLGSIPLTVATVAVAAIVGGDAGWFVSGWRKRLWPHDLPAVLIGAFLTLGIFLAFAMMVLALTNVLTNPP